MSGKVDAVVGLQRGDEGKGRVIDEIADNYVVVARYNGGPNAGHTVVADGHELALHQVPSGILSPRVVNVISGTGFVEPQRLTGEISYLRGLGIDITPKNLMVHYGAHLILPHHVMLDILTEDGPVRTHPGEATSDSPQSKAQGSTKQGIRYTARDKAERIGLRVEDLCNISEIDRVVLDGIKRAITSTEALSVINKAREAANQSPITNIEDFAHHWVGEAVDVFKYIGDTTEAVHTALDAGENVLAEGAQGYWLDIDQGQYPYVTSSDTTVYGAMKALNVVKLDRVYGVAKLCESHVGDGVFVTEVLDPAFADRLRGDKDSVDGEYGKTTERPRRMGYPDLVRLRTALNANNVTDLVLTKLDWLTKFGDNIKFVTSYKLSDGSEAITAPGSDTRLRGMKPVFSEAMPLWDKTELVGVRYADELPENAHRIIEFIQSQLDVKVTFVGVGPERTQLIKYNS